MHKEEKQLKLLSAIVELQNEKNNLLVAYMNEKMLFKKSVLMSMIQETKNRLTALKGLLSEKGLK